MMNISSRFLLKFKTTLILLLVSMFCYPQETSDWENPSIIGINKERYRSSLVLPSNKSEHKEIISLNGNWKFKWSPKPDDRPVDFYEVGFDAEVWDDIVVPGNWQLQGFGKPIYLNINYPFKRDQPFVTGEPPTDWFAYENRNPVGSYITTFILDEDLDDKQFYLYFEGVESAMYLWVNGQKVGYSQNSYSPAEFDVTQFIKPGENLLAVEVYRWSDGSYLENQDFWRLSGIFRPVELWIRPKTHIRDYALIAEPSTDFSSARVGAEIEVRNKSNRRIRNLNLEVSISGRDRNGRAVEKILVKPVPTIPGNSTQTVVLNDVIENPRLWSSEDPYLYDVVISLNDRRGEVESFQYHLGVRRIEIVGDVLKVNGKAIKMKGINRHDHHPRTGRYVDPKTTELDVQLIKQGNFNMVRTAHYPHSALFYELCDRYGLYVMCDANQESHGYGIGNLELGDNPDWTLAHVDRVVSMVQRDKNHPSILFWSLGNEGGSGMNFRAMRDTVRAIDPTRIIYCDSDRSVSDIYDDGYLPPNELKELAERITDRPVMLREYAHAMGNSLGNLQEYWDVIEADKSIAGAAIWDWADQSIAKKRDGSLQRYGVDPAMLTLQPDEFWAYGGDFSDIPNDGPFCLNGLIGADRVPHPHYYEAQRVQQYIDFSVVPGSSNVQVISKLDFTSLHEYEYFYEFLDNGKVIKSDQQPLNANNILEIHYPLEVDGELFLNVYAKLRRPTLWADKGFVVAQKQFQLHPYSFSHISSTGQTPVITKSNSSVEVKSTNSIFVFDIHNGALKSWNVNGDELLQGVLEPYFWKPANDNQRRNGYNTRLGSWRDAAKNRVVKKVESRIENGLAVVVFEMSLPVGASYQLKYQINGEGEIQVEAFYEPQTNDIAQMPKFGMRMRLPAEYDEIIWYGRGEFENYPDRKTAALVGHYNKTLEEFITPFVVPQDNANRGDVRWFSFSNGNSSHIRVKGLQPLCFRAWPYQEEDLETTSHNHLLPRRDFVNVNIDLNIKGVGGNDSWGARTMEQYSIDGNKPYSYGFILNVINEEYR
ncbi:glycoside hydrolase family 2 TIM barrel-domain containing protein [Alkalitalea saponilacus]|nr:glycoside hydrolase family 2 TIM barrel-domain containing protein [Alkalitalea saponilacus]